jgi:RHS repeat-associated protein
LGDVVAIYDSNGAKVVEYAYDAWGNCTVKGTTSNYNLAYDNPIRYRGYYYDEDTKLYYLNARYYSPEWRRFISPDDTYYLDPESVNGLNLYCYCGNDPINFVDPSGHFWDYVLDAVFIAIGIIDLIDEPSWGKAGLLVLDIGMAICPFIPAISGARHLGKIDDIVDLTKTFGHIDNFADSGGVIRRANQMDFVDNGWDLVQTLNRTEDGFTISTHVTGTKIHKTFMSSYRIDPKNIADGIDKGAKIVYELKPYNKRNIRKGIKQLYRYREALENAGEGVYSMVLVLY